MRVPYRMDQQPVRGCQRSEIVALSRNFTVPGGVWRQKLRHHRLLVSTSLSIHCQSEPQSGFRSTATTATIRTAPYGKVVRTISSLRQRRSNLDDRTTRTFSGAGFYNESQRSRRCMAAKQLAEFIILFPSRRRDPDRFRPVRCSRRQGDFP